MTLLRPLPPIALAAEHLAVLGDGAAALAPRRDVVALHKPQDELLAAYLAAVSLLLPHGTFSSRKHNKIGKHSPIAERLIDLASSGKEIVLHTKESNDDTL